MTERYLERCVPCKATVTDVGVGAGHCTAFSSADRGPTDDT
jgi:hypothetical protein